MVAQSMIHDEQCSKDGPLQTLLLAQGTNAYQILRLLQHMLHHFPESLSLLLSHEYNDSCPSTDCFFLFDWISKCLSIYQDANKWLF